MNEFGRVAVLMGGCSAERPISLESGTAVLAALKRKGIEAQALDLAEPEVLNTLQQGGFDRVFIALHGRGGEDGVIQGALETMGIPYTGSGVLGSALAMDKSRAKRIWLSMGVPTPSFIELAAGFDVEVVVASLGLPIMVKPAQEGSSLGASKVIAGEHMSEAWRMASQYDPRVIAERWISGKEYTVALLDGETLPLIRLETPRVFYDYEAKYSDDRTRYICPCGLPAVRERELQALALKGFNALGAQGWGRVDMLVDERDRPWLIEVNTVPGMTGHSLVPMAARAVGISFDDLVVRILKTSFKRENLGMYRVN
jgi:D-alanine-D-alanine ligase